MRPRAPLRGRKRCLSISSPVRALWRPRSSAGGAGPSEHHSAVRGPTGSQQPGLRLRPLTGPRSALWPALPSIPQKERGEIKKCMQKGNNEGARIHAENAIREVPPAMIAELRALDEMDLTNNDVGRLPPELGFLALRWLGLEGNPLRSIRRAIIDKGTPAVLAHLRDKMPRS